MPCVPLSDTCLLTADTLIEEPEEIKGKISSAVIASLFSTRWPCPPASFCCHLSSEIIDKPACLGYSVQADFCSISPGKENHTVRERERELRRRRKRKEESQRSKRKTAKAEAAEKKGK